MSGRLHRVAPSLIVGTVAGLFAWYPISDGDIFWHLAAGREIVRTGEVPHSDPFAYTSKPEWKWIDLHWLYQVAMYGVERAGGLWGILVANSLLFGGAVALLFSTATRTGGAWFSLPLWILALFEVRYLVPHRPVAVSLLLFALFFLFLDRFRYSGKQRYLFALLPFQILWTNCQPLFALGPALFGAWWFGTWLERRFSPYAGADRISTRFALTIALGLLAGTLINPYGIDAWALAFRLFGRIDPALTNLFARNIPENLPLFRMIGTPDVRYLWATLTVTFVALVLIALRPRYVRLSHLLIAGGMLFLAIRAERNIVLYFFAVLPLIGPLIAAVIGQYRGRTVVTIASVALSVAALAAIGSHAAMLFAIRGTGPVAPFSFPVESAAYLQEHGLVGNLYNADRYGGYLLWRDTAGRKVFADTRYAIRPASFFAEYLEIIDHPPRFERVCARFGITAAVLPLSPVPRYLPLARALLHDPSWRLVRCNGAEALFVRDSCAPTGPLRLDAPATVDSLSASMVARWRERPHIAREGLSYFADFLYAMGYERQSFRVRTVSAGH